MLNIFFRSCILSACVGTIFSVSPVRAQQCDVIYETVTKLRYPNPVSYTVWDALYGENKKSENFISVVNKDGGVVAVSEVQSLGQRTPLAVLVYMDTRGHKVWEQSYQIVGLEHIIKILPSKDGGYVVLANRKKPKEHSSVWLGFFDGDGNLKSQKTIQEKATNLRATDIIPSVEFGDWIVGITKEKILGTGKQEIIQKNASIYRLDKNGAVISNRSYILGENNEITGLYGSKFGGDDAQYIATGYFENQAGKKIAQVVRLDQDLSLVWQREFGRGLSAKLNLVTGHQNGGVLVFGDVEPIIAGPDGAWLAMLNIDTGDVVWQRYYYGETGYHDYNARSLYVNADGLISLMMLARKNAVPDAVKGQDEADAKLSDYAHVLTLSPRGVTLSGDAYYYGQGVLMSQMIEGEGGLRVLVGSTLVPQEDTVQDRLLKEKFDPVNVPLKEVGDVDLPDAPMSDKAKEGLALLQKKITSQSSAVDDGQDDHKMVNASSADLAKLGDLPAGWTRNGWVVIGDRLDTYTDPCQK